MIFNVCARRVWRVVCNRDRGRFGVVGGGGDPPNAYSRRIKQETGLPAGAPRKFLIPRRPWRPTDALGHLREFKDRRQICPSISYSKLSYRRCILYGREPLLSVSRCCGLWLITTLLRTESAVSVGNAHGLGGKKQHRRYPNHHPSFHEELEEQGARLEDVLTQEESTRVEEAALELAGTPEALAARPRVTGRLFQHPG